MPDPMIPLVDVFVEMPDGRDRSGRRYALAAILALACAAMLCGYRSYSAIAEWGRNYGQALARQLGFATGVTPCAATLHSIFRKLDVTEFESRLGSWAEATLAASPAGTLEAIAIDGKTLRGSAKQGAPGAHLLSAVSQRLGLTVAQVALADKAGEQSHIAQLLADLVLDGRIVTVDALHTQRAVAQAIIDAIKKAEQVLRASHDELELRVAARTKELSDEIVERKKVERQLRIQTTAMEAAADGIVITDPDGLSSG